MTTLLDAPVDVELLGSTTPRIFTPPLVTGEPGECGCGCALTPATSAGFKAVRFAEEVLDFQLLPWQRFWLIHVLELRPDGSFRFRTVLTLISRQNGKTACLKVLALYFMYVRGAREKVTVLGAAQSLSIAQEAWSGAVDLAEDNYDLAAEIESVRKTNGEQALVLTNGSRYRISAATRGAGRGLSVDLLVLDELREHRNWEAWGALSKTTTARPNALIVGISNAGDDGSVVLNSLRSQGIAATDETLGLFEWSAPDGCELDDVDGWAQANPGLGRTVSAGALRSAMMTDPPATFRTESLCQRVDALDAAIDLESWKAGADPSGSLASVRDRVALCLDVAPDGAHATLCGAAVLDDGRVRVEVIRAWNTADEVRREVRPLVDRIRPAGRGWFPAGPAAALAPEMREMQFTDIKGLDVVETCMSFADLVSARRIAHPSDPLLDAHVAGTSKLRSGDGWRFTRKGVGHVDAAYAAAGAVRIARTLPPPVKRHRARVF